MSRLLAAVLFLTTSSVAQGFSVSISMDEPPILEVIYLNDALKPIEVYEWAIPNDNFWMDIFNVYSGDIKNKYVGRVYRWSDAAYNDFIILKPGEFIYGRIDISKLYYLGSNSDYIIRFNAESSKILRRGETLPGVIGSNQITKYIKRKVHVFVKSAPEVEDGIGFHDCSRKEKDSLKLAHKFGTEYSQEAHAYLVAYPEGELYINWFGEYKKKNYKIVKKGTDKIKKAFEEEFTEYFCGCKDPIAWVYTDRHYEIHVCEEFFEYDIEGVLSQATIAIHEMSHFEVTADTDDHVYGEKKSKKLAKKKPKEAIENADNYLFFSGYVQESKE